MSLNTVVYSCLLLMVSSLFSCEYFIKDKDKNNEAIMIKTKAINTNKDEAKLLLMLSKDNQDVIKLSKVLQNVEVEIDVEEQIIDLAKNLEQTHKEIAQDYNEIAIEKLISIPNYSDLNIKAELLEEDTEAKIKTLNQITSKINNQLNLLNKLTDTTNNEEFKVLAVRAKPKLKKNLDKTKTLLNTIASSS